MIASPLIGVAVGVGFRWTRGLGTAPRVLASLLSLCVAATLFGLAVGLFDLASGAPRRVVSEVILQPVPAVLWAVTIGGFFLFLWPMSYASHALLDRVSDVAPRARIDSDSVGDPWRYRTLDDLGSALERLPAAPRDQGRVSLIVRRGEGGRREIVRRIRLTPEEGVPGDAWGRQDDANPEAQIAVMQTGVASLIANGQPLELFGDNLFVELDLSRGNLPEGARLRAGGATLMVTPKPHNGCRKFRARFGDDALRFVSKPEQRHLNLRGIYLRVTESGEVRQGDVVEILQR
ncbi:MAG: MOSC domain-containing protein [Candidatus Eiseniibacteriota bacterium]